MSDVILDAHRIQKIYKHGDGELQILKGLDLTVNKGDAICIVGPSGAGKSTFLHILGGLDQPTLGHVEFKGESLSGKSEDELAEFRSSSVGFVFQFHHLLAEFTALENVAMPARIAGISARHARRRAEDFMGMLDISHRKTHYPSELSGGEQQRVAIARALMQSPELLMADEPTGNLDTENSQKIQELFFRLREEMKLTLIVVSHDQNFASKFPQVKTLKDGLWTNN